MALTSRSRINSLTSLRFFAAFYVMIFHLEPRWLTLEGSFLLGWTANIIHCGYISVGFFFILSGFVLAYNYGEQSHIELDLKKFWIARFSRLYPVFLLGLIVGFFPALASLQRSDPGAPGILKLGSYALMNLSLLNAWYYPSSILNYPGWSLSAEAFFYCIFPFAALKIWEIRRPRLIGFMVFIATLSVLIPLIAFWLRPDLSFGSDTFLADLIGNNPLIRSTEFLLGIAAGRFFLTRPSSEDRPYGWLVFSLIIFCFVVVSFSPFIPGLLLRNGLLDLPFLGIIYFSAKDKGRWARMLSFGPLLLLGESSYALYILHVPFRDLNLAFIRKFDFAARLASSVWFFVFIAGIIPVSIAVYLKVEEPARKWLKQRLSSRRIECPVVNAEVGI